MVTAIRCPYVMKACENKDCKHCKIALNAIDRASSKLGLCENCGVDRATVKEMLKQDHSDNYWMAMGILNNCPTCRNYFNGGKR